MTPYNERVLLSEFDYKLPDDRIAQAPAADRAGSRMLVIDRASGRWEDRYFRDLPAYLNSGDRVVFNNSRVLPGGCSDAGRESRNHFEKRNQAGLPKSCC